MSLPGITGLIIRAFFDQLADDSSLGFSLWGLLVLLVVTDLAHLAVLFTCRFTKTQLRFTLSALLQRNLLLPLLHRPGALPLMSATETVSTVSSGEAISYFRDDADQIQDTIATISEVIGAGVLAFGAIALLLSINARITLFAFLPLVIMVVIVEQAQKRIKRYRQASRQATEQVTGLIGEMFGAVQAIKVAGKQSQILSHFRSLNEQRRQMMVKDQVLTTMLKSAFENLYSIGTGLILLVAAQLMQSGASSLSVGNFALFIFYLPYVTYFLEFLGGFLTQMKQTEVSFERMAVLLAGAESTGLTPHSQVTRQPKPPAYALGTHTPLYLNDLWGRRPELPPIDPPHRDTSTRLQTLNAHNLTYHYPGTNRGITNVSLQLVQGSLTVITGSVGSGKTTLLRVLLGLLPMQAGEIYWNGERVHDPANFFVPPRSAYTPQVPKLFSYSLRDNLLLGLEMSPAAFKTALHQAVFEQDLAAMPEGLETVIGPRGVRLSGGQLQRAAAARMFIRQPDLLVFDDLSSALDMKTEQALWSRLMSVKARGESGEGGVEQETSSTTYQNWIPTYLVVSHRRFVLQQADRIIVLKNGRIEEGRFDG
jgi:ATP-binding cassette, subfamily B, bacterial